MTATVRPKAGDLAFVPDAYGTHLFRIASIDADRDGIISSYWLAELSQGGGGTQVSAQRVKGVFANVLTEGKS